MPFSRSLTPRGEEPYRWPESLEKAYVGTRSLQLTSGYGLFRSMTKRRREIVIQGSNDEREWKAYEFRYKPGKLDRAPGFVAPHMPRLDWQMWFAALGNYESNYWITQFMFRLLEGSPQVLDLVEHNPFPGAPPRYMRAIIYDYGFTDPAERRATGNWWKRELLGRWSPVLERPDFGDGR